MALQIVTVSGIKSEPNLATDHQNWQNPEKNKICIYLQNLKSKLLKHHKDCKAEILGVNFSHG